MISNKYKKQIERERYIYINAIISNIFYNSQSVNSKKTLWKPMGICNEITGNI
jgi:hypothetical protein